MTERDMEDLVAAYPDDFFPGKRFLLRGRQQSFAGVGRFDLLFEDEFKWHHLMELKARTLRYEDADQVARYRDEFRRRGFNNILMWLVAPQIPSSVREFLDDKGIQYVEIHVGAFRHVAARHDFTIESEREPEPSPASFLSTSHSEQLKAVGDKVGCYAWNGRTEKLSTRLPSVRILPMSSEEFPNKGIEDVQEEYFLEELPRRMEGRFLCYRLLNARPGSIVLFQYLNRLIASAILCTVVRFPEADESGYKGTLNFDLKSIKVFDPIGAEVVSKIWPEFNGFSHAMRELDAKGYPEFEKTLTGIKNYASALESEGL